MANLRERAQKNKKTVMAAASLLLMLFIGELVLIAQIESVQGLSLRLSLVTAGIGLLGVLSLHFFQFKERRYLVKKIVKNLVRQKSQEVDDGVLSKLFEKDFPHYLKAGHIFLPRHLGSTNEFSRVEGLQNFVNNYSTYAGLNLLEEFAEEILDKNESFEFNKMLKLSGKNIFIESALFLLPLSLVQLSNSTPLFETTGVLFASLLLIRLFTLSFYLDSYKDLPPVKFQKIEHFLFGNYEIERGAETTRIELDELVEDDSPSVFFLVDEFRKYEIEKLIRYKTSGNKSFKDWSVISADNSTYKNKVKSSKAFILFPSEMLFPFEEMQEFISAFEKVIIVDSSPSHVLEESAVFYLDQNQKIKRVNFGKNLNRLSGDKGLILRNFKKNNLDLFLTQIEKKIISKKPVYLVYEDVEAGVSCDKNFIYPSGVKMMSISDNVEGDLANKHYCSLNEGKHSEKLNQAKKFVANCSYHKIYSDKAVEAGAALESKVS